MLFAVLSQSGRESCLPCCCHPPIDFLQQEVGYKSRAPWCQAGLWGTAGSPGELMNPEMLPASPARLWKQTDIKGQICKCVRHLRMLLGTSQELKKRPSVSCGTKIDSACLQGAVFTFFMARIGARYVTGGRSVPLQVPTETGALWTSLLQHSRRDFVNRMLK